MNRGRGHQWPQLIDRQTLPYNLEIYELVFRAGLDRSIRSACVDLGVTNIYGGIFDLPGVVFHTMCSTERDFQRLGHRGRFLVEFEIFYLSGPVGGKVLPIKLGVQVDVGEERQGGGGILESALHLV